MDTEQKERILEECRALMSKAKYDESKIEQFCHIVSDILQDLCFRQQDRSARRRKGRHKYRSACDRRRSAQHFT